MKRVLLLVLGALSLWADPTPKAELITLIAKSLAKQTPVFVFIDAEYFKQEILSDMIVSRVDDCREADIIFTEQPEKLVSKCPKALFFVTSYGAYTRARYAVGALFWQKGRPNIFFRREVLLQKGIVLPQTLRRYEE